MSEALYYLFKNYAESDLGIKVNVKIATPSDYFEHIESLVLEESMTLNKYSFDFSNYEE
jgi:hypothetical protein